MTDLSQLLKPMKDAGMKSLKGRAADGSLPIVREFLATLGIERDPSAPAPRDMTEMG